MEEKKTPTIRFRGFNNTWEKRKLSDVLVNRRILQHQSEEAPRLAFASGQGVIDLSERKTNNRDQLIADEYTKNYLLTQYNDIVYNPANLKYGAIDRNKLGQGVISPIYVTFTTEEEPSYIERIVTTEKFKLKALRFEEGTVVKRQLVSPEQLLSFEEMIAPSRIEQKKIGDFFDHLDSLIILHKRNNEKLQNLKKSMLEKMFPKEGAEVPEIRFAGFTGAWEQRALGDVAEIVGGGTPSTGIKEYWSGDIDWYAPTEISEHVFLKGSQKRITELGLKNSSAKILPVGTVLFTSRAGIGNTAILAKMGATNQGFQSIVPHKDGLDSYFIFSRTHELKRYGETFGAGSTFVEVSGKQMAKMPILIPEMSEQKKIGQFFATLDSLITLHQCKLEKLKNIKKSMLDRMFV